MTHRRSFIKYVHGTGFVCFAVGPGGSRRALAEPLPGGTLDPGVVPKYRSPMQVASAMQRAGKFKRRGGLAGPYLLHGGSAEDVKDTRTGAKAVLPGPAPSLGDPPGTAYFELPIVVQDRSFNLDGSRFYPDTRALFDGVDDTDVSPIQNPEVFGNTMAVNGNTWPFKVVERRRYRLRLLNGCQARFLFLDFSEVPGVEVWQVGNEDGFLAAPVDLSAHHNNRVLLGPAERADCIVDFGNVPVGHHLLRNVGPDEPFSGGAPDVDFPASDPSSTGQVLQFRVVSGTAPDPTTPPQFLRLPAASPPAMVTRRLVLLEEMSRGGASADEEASVGPREGQRSPDSVL